VNAEPKDASKTASNTLDLTRQTLLALGQASDELNRKGVTERSRIFAKTSPAFWVAESSRKPALGPVLPGGKGVAIMVYAALALFLLLALLVIAMKWGARRAVGMGIGVVAGLGVIATVAIMIMSRPQQTPALPARVRPEVVGKSAFGAANPRQGLAAPVAGQAGALAPMVREHPIGLDLTRNHLNIALLWHAAMKQASGPAPKPGDVHLLAKIEATEGNPNGFAKGDWVPYLNLTYTIVPTDGGPAVTGVLKPIVAPDGPRYGANLTLPGPGTYRLTVRIAPPADETLGHFVDEADSVAPWWEPFDVSFDWTVGTG
jgi:uncharacterized protein involved in high-affinity Fe2+ transport